MGRETGRYLTTTTLGEEVRAFVPFALPPKPPLTLDDGLQCLLHDAHIALGELRVASKIIPSPEWFIYGFVRKEAVLSSQIEGTQATLMDLLNYEADAKRGANDADIQEVCNYLDALKYGRAQLEAPKGLPLSLRLIREMHKRLMKGVRGQDKRPGEFRSSQNWIGGVRPGMATFVPPPPKQMDACLEDFEKHLHAARGVDLLIDVGLVHVQFETIHPFLDGNGRIGRLLIALLLQSHGLLEAPLLYLSLYFRRNQQEYYRRLGAVRTMGDWEGWTRFFLEGVRTVAREAMVLSQAIFALFEKDRKLLLSDPKMIVAAVRLFEELPRHPVVTMPQVTELLGVTKPTATRAIQTLVKAGILKETTKQARGRMYGYSHYLEMLRGHEENQIEFGA